MQFSKAASKIKESKSDINTKYKSFSALKKNKNSPIKYSGISVGQVLESNEGAKKRTTVSTPPGYQCV